MYNVHPLINSFELTEIFHDVTNVRIPPPFGITYIKLHPWQSKRLFIFFTHATVSECLACMWCNWLNVSVEDKLTAMTAVKCFAACLSRVIPINPI